MIDKRVQSMADAMAGIPDGATVLIGGFGSVGQPNALLEGLIEQGARDLVCVANNAGTGHTGLARLMELGRVRRMVCSFPRSVGSVVFEELYRVGRIELEIVPQGTLAERMRAAGAGIPAFYTPTAAGTQLARGKEQREINGRTYVLEHALHGDVALVEAWRADRWGNLVFRSSGRNFNPVMAMAGRLTIVQTQHLAELGEPRLMRRCGYPLTAPGSVVRVYTNLAVLDVTPRGFAVVEMAPGVTHADLQSRTEAELLPC